MNRRGLLGLSGAMALQALAPHVRAKPLESAELSVVELDVPGDRAFGRALLFLPLAILGPISEYLAITT